MPVKLKQISSVFEPTPNGGGNIHLYAIDEDGQAWQWMRGKWGKLGNPTDNDKPQPNVREI